MKLKNITTSFAPILALAIACISQADAEKLSLNIQNQKMGSALIELGQRAGVQIIFAGEATKKDSITAIEGEYTLAEALDQVLGNSGLDWRFVSDSTVVVKDIKNIGGTAENVPGKLEVDKSSIDEIVVTATRRESTLQDAALSIAAIGSEDIERRNLTEMNDYLRTVPGVSFLDQGVGRNAVVIRGLAMDPQQEATESGATTGIYFGEVSVGGAGSLSGNPDLKMIDLQRVEVLRGPQGTLFGSGALAGAVRNIPNAPDLQDLAGKIKAGYSNTSGFGGDNTKFEGVVNIPLIEDVLAVRAVAYRHDTSGYIKNIAGTQLAKNGTVLTNIAPADAVAAYGGAELYQDKDDIGNAVYNGGRLSALWQPTDNLSLTLQYIWQDVEQEGIPYVQLNLGGYTQAALQYGDNNIPVQGNGLVDDITITNLVAEYDFGWATLLSSTTQSEDDSEFNYEGSSFFSGLPAVQLVPRSYENFSQELRLVSQLDGPFQYVMGMYYEDIDSFSGSDIYMTGDLALVPFPLVFGDTNPLLADQFLENTVKQLAFYGEVSYDFADNLALTGGVRRFDYERAQHYFLSGGLGSVESTGKTEEADTNFKVNLSYEPNEDTHIYLQWAEGFRLGNVAPLPPPAVCDVNNDGILDGTNAPLNPFFDSDSVDNFELGTKLTLLDNQLQINAAVYRINWKDIPIRVFGGKLPEQEEQICFSGFTVNAGEARAQGFEIETSYQLTQSLSIDLGGSYTHAELTGVAVGVPFLVGDRLPSSPDYSVNFGMQYEFELGGYDSYFRSDYSYISEYFNRPGEAGDRGGDYGQLNVSAGTAIGQFNVELFAHNLTDEDAVTSVGTLVPDTRAYRLKPRTIGFNVGYRF